MAAQEKEPEFLPASQIQPRRLSQVSEEIAAEAEERIGESRRTELSTVHVVEETGAPIAGAEFMIEGGEGSFVSDAAGLILLPIELAGRECQVSAAGFQTVIWTFPAPPVQQQRVILRRLASIAGLVRSLDGAAAYEEVSVIAWPKNKYGNWPTKYEILSGKRGGEPIFMTQAKRNGAFTIFVDEAFPAYVLIAAGGGHLSFQPDVVESPPEGSGVLLELRPAYVFWLEVRTRNGKPIVLSESLFRTGIAVRFAMEFEGLSRRDIRVWLAGYDPGGKQKEDIHSRTTVIVGKSILDPPPEAQISIAIPGYIPEPDLHSRFQFIGDVITPEVVTVTQTTVGFGDLKLLFNTPDADWLNADNTLANGLRLYLKSINTEDSKVQYWYNIKQSADNAPIICDIPFGVYDVSLVDWGNRAIELDANNDQITVMEELTTIDLREVLWGCIELDIRDKDGTRWTGSAHAKVGEVFREDGAIKLVPYFFKGPPYRIPVTRFGKYAGYCYTPSPMVVMDGESHVFEVSANECKVIVVQEGVDPPLEERDAVRAKPLAPSTGD